MFPRLHKPKGYPFASVELGRVITIEAKERVIAQVDSTESIKFVQEVALKYKISSEEENRLIAIAQNCHGMIHIFSPEQVELVDDSPKECEECGGDHE